MVYVSADKQTRSIMDHENGRRLAAEARDRGDHKTAWMHAQKYGLNALDILELGLPERLRPKGFDPEMPKNMGCV